MEQTWLNKAIELWQQNYKWMEIAEQLKNYFPEYLTDKQIADKIRHKIHRKIHYKSEQSDEEYKYSFGIDNNGNTYSDRLIEICEGEKLTPDRVLELHGLVPTSNWEIITYRNNYWHSQVKGGTRLLMYQSKVTAKPANKLDLNEIEEHFNNLDRQYQTSLPIVTLDKDKRMQMAEVNIADLHLGKVYYDDVNDILLNSDTSTENWCYLIDEISKELMGRNIEYINFVWCNDFFNSDTITKTTTSGTQQDTDLPWTLLFKLGIELLIYAIERFRTIAPVHTFYTASNHDTVNSYHALLYLQAWFRNEKDVIFETNSYPRKYILYGNTLIGYTHGDKSNPKKLSGIMPVEAADLWSKSLYREFHTAHFHSELMIEELNGVIVRRISSPSFADEWHIQNSFVGAIKKAQTFIYDKEFGLTHIINTPLKI